jgi:hypothetical protein
MTTPDLQSADLPESPAGWTTEEWKPTLGISIVWNLLGLLLVIVGFVGFGILAVVLSGETTLEVGFGSFPILGLMLVAVLVIHELVHGAAMLMFGARPQFGVALIQRILPVAYCTSPGHWFTRGQFMVVSLSPVVGMSAVGVALMPIGDLAALMVIPLAINLGGGIGDLWFAGMLLRKPGNVMIEDLRDGLRFHEPHEAGTGELDESLPAPDRQG